MPEDGYPVSPKDEMLTFEELARLVHSAARRTEQSYARHRGGEESGVEAAENQLRPYERAQRLRGGRFRAVDFERRSPRSLYRAYADSLEPRRDRQLRQPERAARKPR